MTGAVDQLRYSLCWQVSAIVARRRHSLVNLATGSLDRPTGQTKDVAEQAT